MGFIEFWAGLGKSRTERIADRLFAELRNEDDGKTAHDRVVDASGPHTPTLQQCEALVDVCARLPLRQRLALEMSIKGYSGDEIARSLGITHAIAISELAAALHELEKASP